jgi:NAD(P)H-flavin reductase
LDSLQASKFLNFCGFFTPEITEATDYEQVKNTAEKFGWPVVLKISSPNILHKTELGGVVTEISNEEELKNAWGKLQQIIGQLDQETKTGAKILIQKDIENGVEVIAGIKNDPTFGPILLFGAGGTLAELILDRNIHLLPLNITQAKKLVGQSKIISVLKGYRGGSVYALDRLYELLVRLSKIAESFPQVLEMEINPVIVTLNNTFAVDGKVLLKQAEVKLPAGPKFKEATIARHDVLAGNYHYFVLQMDTPLVYNPGQYISVKVAESRINSYSIAGHEGNNFSLLIDTTPGGPGSQYFQSLKTGDKISFLGPFGIFNLKPDDGAKQILFLGTGSGCSPLRSILESALKEKKTSLPITLYFGLRYRSDVFWQDYFEKLSKEYPNFKFKLVLSKPDETWQGQVGHITEFVKKDFPNANDCSAYLCGNKQMIEQASEILLSRGCKKERIYSEKF